jgi:hypothetical protein
MSKANPMNFYRKISKKNAEVSSALQKVLESGNVDVSTVMAHYFETYWNDFKAFWEESGEKILWVTFALAPHNATWLVQWVFHHHADVMEQVESDMRSAGWIQ